MPNSSNAHSPYTFDSFPPRQNTGSMKWDMLDLNGALPMWVADMDFRSPPCVIEALRDYMEHGIFGYAIPQDSLYEAVLGYLQTQFDWRIEKDWIVWLPGLVTGINVATLATTESGDGVITAVPIYPPFASTPKLHDRELITVQTRHDDQQRWWLDPADLASKAGDPAKVLLLCNPHNPVGRVYTRDELLAYADIAEQQDLIICSDEIHCDLILDQDKRHIPIASLSTAIADRTITLMAPSKTYNLPGFGCSFAIISNNRLRAAFKRQMRGIVPEVNGAGLIATEAAYRHGESWRQDLLTYLRENRDYLVNRIAAEMPELKVNHVEATYLAWLNVEELAIDNPVGHFKNHGTMLSDGSHFLGPGYVRLNFGCPRSMLQEALDRMQKAMEALR